MSFVFNNCTIGDGAQFITVEAGASLTLQLGSGYRTANNSTANNSTARCPLKLADYKAELKSWAQRSSGSQAPEGYQTETWGGSPKVFDDGVPPQGLSKGDTLFFWKSGVTDPKSHPVPEGFEAVFALNDVFIIVPVLSGDHSGDDTEDNCPTTPNADQADLDSDYEDELSGADASLEVPQDSLPWDDDDDEDEGDGPINDRPDDDDDDDDDESFDL